MLKILDIHLPSEDFDEDNQDTDEENEPLPSKLIMQPICTVMEPGELVNGRLHLQVIERAAPISICPLE